MIKKFCFLFLSLVAIFLVSMFGICLIPTSAIAPNIKESAQTLRTEWLYPVSYGNKYATLSYLCRDQYTDCLMINLAASIDSDNPLESALTSPCLKDHKSIDELPSCLERLADGVTSPNVKYDWYWHGYLVVLRPLLLLIDYERIRLFNCFIMLVLFVLSLYLIQKKINKSVALLFLGVALLSHGETIPFTMQYASVFFVTLISICVLLWKTEYFAKENRDLYAFFAIGAITVFVDFLTMPSVSLGIPLIFWLCFLSPNIQNKKLLYKVITLSISWGIGYAILWVTKWGVCAMTFDPDVLVNAAQHADKWSGNQPEFGGRFTATFALLKRSLALLWNMNWIWLLLMMIIVLIWKRVPIKTIKQESWLLLIALIPVVWSIVLVNHDVAHFGFVWRGYITTLLALSVFFWRVNTKNYD